MNRLTNTLNFILSREEDIKKDIKRNSSKIINNILKENYQEIDGVSNSTKICLLTVWTMVVEKASKKYSRSWKKLFEALDRVLNIIYTNENTVESTLTEFRKPLKNEKFDPMIYTKSTHIMGVSRERSHERKKEYKDKVAARNENRGQLVPIYVSQVIDVIQKLFDSADAYEQAMAVLLATGSRPVEVFKVSKYSAAPNPKQVVVKGLAKDNGKSQDVTLIRNVVGLSGSQVVSAVKEIREKLETEGLTNRQISDRNSQKLNRTFKKYIHPLFITNAGDKADSEEFKDQMKNLTAHKARYIGGNASYQIYAKPKNFPEESYLQKQYGHLSPESTKSYLAIRVINQPAPPVEELKELKEKIDKCCSPTASIDSAGVDLKDLVNTRKKGIPEQEKVNKFLEAIRRLKAANVTFKQKQLMKKLKYSSSVAGEAYRFARNENLI